MSTAPPVIVYPYCDGEPMADNMRQARWMMMLLGNLDAVLDCFVGCNNFWFPVEGEPEVRLAPDVYVAFGRPKDPALESYRQWEQADTPVTVVFEIWSPGNNKGDLEEKYTFYTEHGVEEFYVYDPYRYTLDIYLRHGTALMRWPGPADGFRSPRMGITFHTSPGQELVVRRPDGRLFLTVAELDAERRQEASRAAEAEAAREQAEAAREQAEGRAANAERRASRLAELSRKARRGQASADELAELERLEDGV